MNNNQLSQEIIEGKYLVDVIYFGNHNWPFCTSVISCILALWFFFLGIFLLIHLQCECNGKSCHEASRKSGKSAAQSDNGREFFFFKRNSAFKTFTRFCCNFLLTLHLTMYSLFYLVFLGANGFLLNQVHIGKCDAYFYG